MIRGAGGGGSSSSSSSTATEDPDSLRSRANARIVDLVSEGEIEGLVGGLTGVYLDSTPLMNDDGSFNFSNVSVQTRNGTQAQTYVEGFASVENSTSLGVEVKATTPFTRHYTNANLNAVRLTIGIPVLSYQDTSSGNTTGTAVALQVDLQTNGGGFVSVPIGSDPVPMTFASGVLSSNGGTGTEYQVTVIWFGSVLSCTYRLEYRVIGAASWSTYATRTISKSSTAPSVTGSDSLYLSLASGAYEFRAVMVSGSGTLVLQGTYGQPGYTLTISGKTTSRYQRSIRVPVTGTGPWDIRVRRLTADSTSSYLQNKTYVDVSTEIVDSKLRYPNSAYVALSADSSQFSSIPTRAYHLRGLRIKVPSNYNPATRAYTGVWDGTFKIAWTDNPAWCFYDLLTNDRYGLGGFVSASQVDKWALYTIGQYCDELVDDGFGNQEPRFTCNLYLQSRAEAYKVLNDFVSIFRGLIYWSAASITTVQDSPSDAAYLYTPANVIDGTFTYQGSSGKARHTVALVTWNDPDEMYSQSVEYVEDQAGIARYGIVSTEVTAFGCTSRGQAHRVGKWLLFTERLQTEVVTFKTGMDGNLCRPGQIIKVADPARAGVRLGGRLAAATTTAVTLDAPVTLASGVTYTLSTLKSDGTVQDTTVTTAAGTVSALTLSPAFAEAPAVGGVWILASTAVEAQTFRVVSVTEASATEFEVSALAHDPDKFDLIESDIALESRSISTISAKPLAPTDGVVSEYLYEAATDLKTIAEFSWTASTSSGVVGYIPSYRVGDGNWVELPRTTSTSTTVQDAQTGAYSVAVRSINALGMISGPLSFTGDVLGKVAPPAAVANLQLQIQTGTGLMSWNTATDLDVRLGGKVVIRHSTSSSPTWSTAIPLAEFAGSSTSGTVPLLAGTYLAKFEDTSGSQSTTATLVVTNAPTVLQYNVVLTDAEEPTFAGMKAGVEVSGGKLLLSSSSTWDVIADMDALVTAIDGGTVESGVYEFAAPIDLGGVYSCRVTADLGVSTYDLDNIVDGWTSVDALADIDGGIAGDSADVRVYISTTQDDPSGAPVWTDWRLFSVGDYLARGYRFKVTVARGSLMSQQVAISRLAITIDVPDRVEGGRLVSVPTGGIDIAFSATFYNTPAIAITADSMATGDYYVLSSKTAAGFNVRFYNSAGTAISKTMDWIAKGFGYKV